MNARANGCQILILVLVTACGGGPNPDKDSQRSIPSFQNISGEKFTILASKESLSMDHGTISGAGSLRFSEDLGGVDTGFNYVLTFSLEDSGELTLVSHSNASLEHGLEFIFKRVGTKLMVHAKAGSITDDWSSFFTSFDASQIMKIAIDVHNNESVTHVIFWNDLISTNAQVLDSGSDVNGSPGKGYGQNWGLKLKSSTITSVTRGGPRNEH